MKAVATRYCSLAVALALAFTAGTGIAAEGSAPPAAPAGIGASFEQDGLKLYLSDPELGLVGRYRDGADVIYFEARRDPGVPGSMALRLLDADARLLAYAGQDLDAMDGVDKSKAAVDGQIEVLASLSAALAGLNLHAALSSEKDSLTSLAASTAIEAQQYPYAGTLTEKAVADVDAATVADFYARALTDVRMQRNAAGELAVAIGEGLAFESQQQFLPLEPDEDGVLGRHDVYSRVVNAEGHHLVSELGGDHVPHDWWELHAETEPRARAHDEVATEAGIAAMALNGMSVVGDNARGLSFGNQLELDAMQRMSRSLAENLLPVADIGIPGMVEAKSGRYRTKLQVHRKRLVVIAEHSATRVLKYFYSSTTSNVITASSTVNYCNHGACPGGSAMSQKCTYTGPRTNTYRVPPKNWGSGTCTSVYRVAGVVLPWSNHNCHDDSAVQLRIVKGQSWGSRCGDGPLFWGWAPGC